MESELGLRDVRCFVCVARVLSFSRAAAELGMSQPAVSQAVGRLERASGVRLFERTSREVRLSTAGKGLLARAEALLEAAASFSAEAARLAISPRPVIRLAYAPLVGGLAARAARRLGEGEPSVDVELRAMGWRAATQALTRGEVGVAILGAPFPVGFTTGVRFHVTVGHLAVPAGDPLAGLARLTPAQLGRHRVLLPRNRPPGGMWARVAATLRGEHQHRVVGEDIDDFTAVLDLVAAGAGLLPVPHLLAASIRRDDVRFVPFDAGDLRLTFGLAWPPGRVPSEVTTLVHTVQRTLWTR
ncbi:LysR family transcriptional regulator [Sphaerisporangium sp. TRM90804]|uniref:LysR family transcriptional regulator n=1 Tax=Sphaerisporangium sp. TRM90804 TaxID=3031113 RepID=UPI00244B1535|nr:LysR family transcriptional regulator [Sphaerisporangium sp. TRM90804]MDH2427485.1 LysR family transcriptional regulator [Sphaerisporangium sp. TRM90804]